MLKIATILSVLVFIPAAVAAKSVTYLFDLKVTFTDGRPAPATLGSIGSGTLTFNPQPVSMANEYYKVPFIESARYWVEPFSVSVKFGAFEKTVLDNTIKFYPVDTTLITIQSYPLDSIMYDIFDFRGRGQDGIYGLFQWHGTSYMLNDVNLSVKNFDRATSSMTGTQFSIGSNAYWMSGTLSNVRAAAIPEPQSWSMLIAGFGMIGSVARRRSPTKWPCNRI